MTAAYDPNKGESFKTQFNRTITRWKKQWNKQPLTLDDVGTIKLPAVNSLDYFYGIEPSYFATRNEGGKWNIDKQESYGGEYPVQNTTVATDLDLPQLLAKLAELNPKSMEKDTDKFWHPVSIAKLAGLAAAETPAPQAPKAATAAPGV